MVAIECILKKKDNRRKHICEKKYKQKGLADTSNFSVLKQYDIDCESSFSDRAVLSAYLKMLF